MIRKFILNSLHIALYSATLLIASRSIDGVDVPENDWVVLLSAGALLWIGETIIRPIANLLAFPFIAITLGLFRIVINLAILSIIVFISPYIEVSGISPFISMVAIISIAGIIINLIISSLDKN